MEKTNRLIHLLVIFIPLILFALVAGIFSVILFEIRRWEMLLFNL